MLVVTREPGNGKSVIKIGDSITVTVVNVQGDRVQVGVEAPRSISILRGELEPREKGLDEQAA